MDRKSHKVWYKAFALRWPWKGNVGSLNIGSAISHDLYQIGTITVNIRPWMFLYMVSRPLTFGDLEIWEFKDQ